MLAPIIMNIHKINFMILPIVTFFTRKDAVTADIREMIFIIV